MKGIVWQYSILKSQPNEYLGDIYIMKLYEIIQNQRLPYDEMFDK